MCLALPFWREEIPPEEGQRSKGQVAPPAGSWTSECNAPVLPVEGQRSKASDSIYTLLC